MAASSPFVPAGAPLNLSLIHIYHTTVMHACKRIKELRNLEQRIQEDYSNLLRTLTG